MCCTVVLISYKNIFCNVSFEVIRKRRICEILITLISIKKLPEIFCFTYVQIYR